MAEPTLGVMAVSPTILTSVTCGTTFSASSPKALASRMVTGYPALSRTAAIRASPTGGCGYLAGWAGFIKVIPGVLCLLKV